MAHTPQKTSRFSEEELGLIELAEECLGYEFNDKSFLAEAITHASVANTRLNSYERLEFLGDSVLGFLVCEYLFQQFPELLEGDLTKIKSNVVSRQSCADIGKKLKIDKCLVVGKGVGRKGVVPKSLLANAFESIVAAIYLDGGLESIKTFLMPIIKEQVAAAVDGGLEINYKSELQQYAQKRYGVPPNYRLLDDRGPDHDKWFQVAATIDKRAYTPAWGKNKKEAEQKAAANALAAIEGSPPPFQQCASAFETLYDRPSEETLRAPKARNMRK